MVGVTYLQMCLLTACYQMTWLLTIHEILKKIPTQISIYYNKIILYNVFFLIQTMAHWRGYLQSYTQHRLKNDWWWWYEYALKTQALKDSVPNDIRIHYQKYRWMVLSVHISAPSRFLDKSQGNHLTWRLIINHIPLLKYCLK